MAAFPDIGCPIYGSFQRSGPSGHLLRTQMEVGRPKIRRRSSMGRHSITAAYAITSAELTAFETWHDTTIGAGLETFDWTDPRTGTSRAVRFTEDGYSIARISPARWQLSVSLEEWI